MNVNAIFCVSIAPCKAAVQDLFDQENKKKCFLEMEHFKQQNGM